MILTITLNPSVDRRYNLHELKKGSNIRTDNYQYTIGGKGINVSKVIDSLGIDVIATGFLGGYNGDFINEGLKKYNIVNKFIDIKEESRSCIAIITEDGSQTEILECGPYILESDIKKFLLLYTNLLDKVDIIIASGSLPRGTDNSIYRELIKMAYNKGKKFILDTSKDALKLGIDGLPYLIKPNKRELEEITDKKLNTLDDIINAGDNIIKKGVRNIVISLGKDGAIIFKGSEVYKANALNEKILNPVGSGDAMVAGIATGIFKNMSFIDSIKLGLASGTSNAMNLETGKIDNKVVEKLIKRIDIKRIR